MRFILWGILVLITPTTVFADCLPGDPLCAELPSAKPAAPVASTKKPPKIPPKKPQPKHNASAPQVRKQPAAPVVDKSRPNYTEILQYNGNGTDQAIRFDDDGLSGDAPRSDTIRAQPSRVLEPMQCMKTLREIYREMYPDADEIDDPSHPFTPEFKKRVLDEQRKALKCLEPCRTEQDLDFLMTCSDPFAPESKTGCDPERLRKAIREGRFQNRTSALEGGCADLVLSETHRSGRAKNDVVLLVDNSGSMSDMSKSVVPLVSAMVAAKAKALGADTRFIMLSQNLNEKPVVFLASDPGLQAKVEAKVRDYYDRSDSDADERPLLALTKNLPGVVRGDAAINILVLTDEIDSSVRPSFMKREPGLLYRDSSAEYVAALRKLSEGGVVLHSTEPDDMRGLDDKESHPLHAAARLTSGVQLALSSAAFKEHLDEMLVRGQEKKLILGPLPKETNPDSVLVTWDGRELAATEYRYDPATRMVIPAFTYDPEAKHEVRLQYQLTHRRERELSRGDQPNSGAPSYDAAEKQAYAKWPEFRKKYLAWAVLPHELPEAVREEHRLNVREYVTGMLQYSKPVSGDALYLFLGQESAGVVTLAELYAALDRDWTNRLFDGDWQKHSALVLKTVEGLTDAQLAELLRRVPEKRGAVPAFATDGKVRSGLELLMAAEKPGCDTGFTASIAKWLEASEKDPQPAQPRLLAGLQAHLRAKHFLGVMRCHGQSGAPNGGKKLNCP